MTKKEQGGLVLVGKGALRGARLGGSKLNGSKWIRRRALEARSPAIKEELEPSGLASPWIKPRAWDMSVEDSGSGPELEAANDPLMEEPPGRA